LVYMPVEWCAEFHKIGTEKYSIPAEQMAIFTAPQSDTMKEKYSRDLQQINSTVRLTFATSCYGMGANPPNFREVLHITAPCSLRAYTQQIGRVARDGDVGVARMFVCRADIGKPTMTASMREFIKLKSCRRVFLLKFFGYEIQPEKYADRPCCDNCDKAAANDESNYYEDYYEDSDVSPDYLEDSAHYYDDDRDEESFRDDEEHEETYPEEERVILYEEDMELAILSLLFPTGAVKNLDKELKSCLLNYFMLENEECDGPFNSNGLSDQFANVLSLFPDKYRYKSNIKNIFPTIDEHYLQQIVDIINCYLSIKSTS